MRTLVDDLGYPVELNGVPQRVISLVPSLTEAIAATCRERLVGATDWCIEPGDLAVQRVRGTKNPDRRAIGGLQPDLVIANKEENRALDVQRLRADGIPVWVTDITTVPEALASMTRLFGEVLRTGQPEWLTAAGEEWGGPAPEPTLRVACAIWRDPWMVVGARTYTDDLLSRLGWHNVWRHTGADGGSRYPHVELADLDVPGTDVVLLPDEPYVFTVEDGPEAFSRCRTALLSGRLLTWYGPAMVGAKAALRAAVT